MIDTFLTKEILGWALKQDFESHVEKCKTCQRSKSAYEVCESAKYWAESLGLVEPMNFERAKQAVDRMQNTPLKRLYAETLDTIKLLEADLYTARAKRLGDALWGIIQYAVSREACTMEWYASEPCRRPQARDDAHCCGEIPSHEGPCRCVCGEVHFK